MSELSYRNLHWNDLIGDFEGKYFIKVLQIDFMKQAITFLDLLLSPIVFLLFINDL